MSSRFLHSFLLLIFVAAVDPSWCWLEVADGDSDELTALAGIMFFDWIGPGAEVEDTKGAGKVGWVFTATTVYHFSILLFVI